MPPEGAAGGPATRGADVDEAAFADEAQKAQEQTQAGSPRPTRNHPLRRVPRVPVSERIRSALSGSGQQQPKLYLLLGVPVAPHSPLQPDESRHAFPADSGSFCWRVSHGFSCVKRWARRLFSCICGTTAAALAVPAVTHLAPTCLSRLRGGALTAAPSSGWFSDTCAPRWCPGGSLVPPPAAYTRRRAFSSVTFRQR